MTASVNDHRASYKNPPAIEAVISVHFVAPLNIGEIDAFARKRQGKYPRVDDNVEISTSFETPTRRAVASTRNVGKKLTSGDGSYMINFISGQMAVIKLAPYAGWEALFTEGRENWDFLVKIIDKKALSMVSTRFINRIDVPVSPNDKLNLNAYFNLGLSLPSKIVGMDLNGFNINFGATDEKNQYRTVINFTSAPQAIIDHLSFTVDIDVITIDQLPLKDDLIWDRVNSLRQIKNDLFKSLITDQTRMLFG